MKKYFILFFLTTLLPGCDDKKLTPNELVIEYYDAFNSSDFTRITTVIADSITIVEGEYIMSYSQKSFHEQFKWDSIFQPSYKIVELENQNSQIIATVASNSKRYEFLKNNPLTCRYKISFNSDKITKLEVLECLDADWNVWQKERDSLINWVNANHPELDGFIHDLTMNGAINYLEVIQLYEERQDAL
ncbi:hypothetical protein [Algoriphagus resistens]|uniref:hypothetical protein n=1 Tax=Algoriphagus resistens TaxID=1750590 RepID=UPI0007169CF2|nr:hypothetical protein [Algoriphagus resistens]